MANVTIPNRISSSEASANLDVKYGPYESLAAAHAALGPEGRDKVAIGLTVGILDGNTIREYWYQGGTELVNLVPKQASEITVDDRLIENSANPVQSKVIQQALEEKATQTDLDALERDVEAIDSSIGDTEPLVGTIVENIIGLQGDIVTAKEQAVKEATDVLKFNSIISDPITIEQQGATTVDYVVWHSVNKKFYGVKVEALTTKYYIEWSDRDNYMSNAYAVRTDKVFVCDGHTYVWDGTDLIGSSDITVDSSVTEGSDNPVSGNGVYDAIEAAKTSIKGNTENINTLKDAEDAIDEINENAAFFDEEEGSSVTPTFDPNSALIKDTQILTVSQKDTVKANILNRPATAVTGGGLGHNYLPRFATDGQTLQTITQEVFNTANTIYHIQYDFEVSSNVTMPAGCVLQFEGGSISGSGTIVGTDTRIEGTKNISCTQSGTWIDRLTQFIDLNDKLTASKVYLEPNGTDVSNTGLPQFEGFVTGITPVGTAASDYEPIVGWFYDTDNHQIIGTDDESDYYIKAVQPIDGEVWMYHDENNAGFFTAKYKFSVSDNELSIELMNNKITQDMLTAIGSNKIIVVQDFFVVAETLTMPVGTTFEFEAGGVIAASVEGQTITGDNTGIIHNYIEQPFQGSLTLTGFNRISSILPHNGDSSVKTRITGILQSWDAGYVFYDTTNNEPCIWDGSAWSTISIVTT